MKFHIGPAAERPGAFADPGLDPIQAGEHGFRDSGMSEIAAESKAASGGIANAALFFRRWLANPLQMGSVIPSSPALCRRIAALIERREDEVVVELGAGTGVVSRALLAAGVPAERLVVVEIVPEMAEHLRHVLPSGVSVITGDAFALADALPRRWHHRVGTVICGIPLVLLPHARQSQFVAAVDAVAPGRGFLLYSYCVTSPLPARSLGLTAQRMAWTPANFPPASVWRYRPGSVAWP